MSVDTVTHKLLDRNTYLLTLLSEMLDLTHLNFLNLHQNKHFFIDCSEDKNVELDIEVDCPFGEGTFLVKCVVEVKIYQAKFKGSYYLPPDPDEIEIFVSIQDVYFYDSDGEEYHIDLSKFHRSKELITKIEEQIEYS